MSNQFLKLRRSAVPGKIPDTGSLDLGEIALNTYDGLAFMKRSGSSGEEIIVIGNSTGSYTGSFTGEFTGSLLGTASWAYNAVTASTADNFYVRGNLTGSNALITGTITAQTLVVQTITSSIIYSSGSNVFGNKLTDTQQFTGSVSITGSLTSANVNLTGSYTGSFFGDGSGLTNISASSVVGLNLSLIGSGSVTASTDPAYGFKVNSNTQISGSTQITGSLGVTGSVSISGSLGSVFSANIDTMVFSGSLYQTGSIEVTGSVNITGSLKAVIADISGSFSGSFFGNGGGLTNISASSIVGLNLSQIASGSATASISPDKGLRINVDTTVTGSIRSTSNIYANQFVFQDGVIDSNSTGQYMFGTNNNTFYLFSGNNGLLIRNQGDSDTLVTLTNDGSLTVPYGITGSLYGTASWALNAISSSYAATASFALNVSDNGYIYTQASPASTWTINHYLQTLVPIVQVYDSSYNQLIPSTVTILTSDTVEITFAYPITGYAIISKGSGVSSVSAVSSSYALTASYAITASYASNVGFNFEQVSPSDTWTINHNLNNRHPLVQIYDADHLTLIPQSISGSTVNTVVVTFAFPISGYARIV